MWTVGPPFLLIPSSPPQGPQNLSPNRWQDLDLTGDPVPPNQQLDPLHSGQEVDDTGNPRCRQMGVHIDQTGEMVPPLKPPHPVQRAAPAHPFHPPDTPGPPRGPGVFGGAEVMVLMDRGVMDLPLGAPGGGSELGTEGTVRVRSGRPLGKAETDWEFVEADFGTSWDG